MKAIVADISFFFLHVAIAVGHIHHDHGAGKLAACQTPPCQASPAPAEAGSPAPEPPGLEALHISFEIANFNYYDLTKVTCPEKVKVPKKAGKVKAKVKANKGGKKAPKDPAVNMAKQIDQANVTKAMSDIHGNTETITEQVKEFDGFGKQDEAPKLPWAKKKKPKDAAGNEIKLLQVGACAAMPDLAETKSKECTTVQDVLKNAIIQTVRSVIKCVYEEGLTAPPGPAPAAVVGGDVPAGVLPAAPAAVAGLVPLPPQSFLQRVPSPAPAAPGPAPVMAAVAAPGEAVKIFVTFSPGKEIAGGATTMVEIAFLDAPTNGVDDVAAAMPYVNIALANGQLKKQMKKALHQVTGIKPKLKGIKLESKVIKQFDVVKCERHIKDIVQQFTLHYTHDQVPRALYNECTNFMTRISFSHDHVLDPQDTIRCRKATATFAKKWADGDNAVHDSDFEGMCLSACEAKYGKNAPTCNLHAGDQLLNQPLL